MFCNQSVRRKARSLRVECLEGRELLSGVTAQSSANSALVVAIYQHELHRDPTPRELRHSTVLLTSGVRPITSAAALLVSPGYHATHQTQAAFVDGLYHDVLGRDIDPAGEQLWVDRLQHHQMTRLQVAKAFLRSPGSFLSAPQAGGITNVAATNGWSSGIIGSSTAFVAGVFNRGTPPTIVTINVTAGGQYTLNQSQGAGSFIGNNSGNTWKGFTLTILSSSTAGASFVNSSDASGHFPTVNRSASVVQFSGGTVTSGSNVITNGFQPVTTISTKQGGTIVIQESSINA